MAKVNFGAIATDARGKVKGIVYSKNKSGSYVRGKVTPANPNTPSQSNARQGFSTLSKAWSGTLTDAQRAAWIAYAGTYPRNDIFGASINLSGINMFISLNQVLQTISEPIDLDPPGSNVVTPIPFDPASLVAASTGAVSFTQTVANPITPFNFYVFAAPPLPAGRQPQKSDFRFLGKFVPAPVTVPNGIAIGTQYVAKFGSWATGQRISILVATVDITTGLTTVGTVMSAIST